MILYFIFSTTVRNEPELTVDEIAERQLEDDGERSWSGEVTRPRLNDLARGCGLLLAAAFLYDTLSFAISSRLLSCSKLTSASSKRFVPGKTGRRIGGVPSVPRRVRCCRTAVDTEAPFKVSDECIQDLAKDEELSFI